MYFDIKSSAKHEITVELPGLQTATKNCRNFFDKVIRSTSR